MLKTKEYVAENGKTYYLHNFPAYEGESIYNRMRAINGDADKRDQFTLLVMPYVSVRPDTANPQMEMKLDTKILINNHVDNAKILMDIEDELLAWNFDFLAPGEIFACLNLEKVADNSLNTKMFLDLLDVLSTVEEQPSTNSKPSTRSRTHTKSGSR